MSFIDKIVSFFEPVVKFVAKIEDPWSRKKITGDDYDEWKEMLQPGDILLSSTYGFLSNLFNPGRFKHGAMYIGTGLKSRVESICEELSEKIDNSENPQEIEFLHDIYARLSLMKSSQKLSDDDEYVVEATTHGVVVTKLVTFMTTKDDMLVMRKNGDLTKMQAFALIESCLYDILLPYDFKFSDSDETQYCYELVADAYNFLVDGVKIEPVKIFGGKKSFTSESFLVCNSLHIVLDSKEKKSELTK